MENSIKYLRKLENIKIIELWDRIVNYRKSGINF